MQKLLTWKQRNCNRASLNGHTAKSKRPIQTFQMYIAYTHFDFYTRINDRPRLTRDCACRNPWFESLRNPEAKGISLSWTYRFRSIRIKCVSSYIVWYTQEVGGYSEFTKDVYTLLINFPCVKDIVSQMDERINLVLNIDRVRKVNNTRP